MGIMPMQDNHEYTEEMYEEDRKLAHFTYMKFFHKYSFNHKYYDDLMQVAVARLAHVRLNNIYNSTKGEYSTFAIKVCKNAMFSFTRFEYRKTRLMSDTPLGVTDEKEFTLEDYYSFKNYQQEQSNILVTMKDLKEIIKLVILRNNKQKKNLTLRALKERECRNKIPKELKVHQQIAFDYFINGKSMPQITTERNISRQAVSAVIQDYNKLIKEELIKRELA